MLATEVRERNPPGASEWHESSIHCIRTECRRHVDGAWGAWYVSTVRHVLRSCALDDDLARMTSV